MKLSGLPSRSFVTLAALLLITIWTGCRSTYGGPGTVTYFQPGPEFKLASEAAAMKAASEEAAAKEFKSSQANAAAEGAAQDTKR
jgi:hypothetical protein